MGGDFFSKDMSYVHMYALTYASNEQTFLLLLLLLLLILLSSIGNLQF